MIRLGARALFARVSLHLLEAPIAQDLLPYAQVEQWRVPPQRIIVIPEPLSEAPDERVPAPEGQRLHDAERPAWGEQPLEVRESLGDVMHRVQHVGRDDDIEALLLVPLGARILGDVE